MKRNVSKSLLFICLGLITTIVFTSASMLYSHPGPPGKPQAYEVLRDQCSIRYSAPKDDGGSSITGYIIECCNMVTGEWFKVSGKYPITECVYTVTGMVEGSKVRFRVRAVNAAGYGEPSKESDIITIEDPFN